MTRKTKAAYIHLFKAIEHEWKLKPSSVTTDFESALRGALQSIYPNVRLIGWDRDEYISNIQKKFDGGKANIKDYFDEIIKFSELGEFWN